MKYYKHNEYDVIKYLRFRLSDPKLSTKTYMNLRSIAKFINKSVSYV